MRDPYDTLGFDRSASLDEIKAAYRRACKSKHPDMGGPAHEFIELQNAYEFVLNNLKRAYEQQREEASHHEHAARDRAYTEDERRWEKTYRDIDGELEELRRATHVQEEQLRRMRAEALDCSDLYSFWNEVTFINSCNWANVPIQGRVFARRAVVLD